MKTILSILSLLIGCSMIASAQNSRSQITKEDSIFASQKINPKDFEGIKASTLEELLRQEKENYPDYLPVVIPEYFILGTLSNYEARHEESMLEDEVDYYYPGEIALAEYLETYIKENLTRDVLLQTHSKGYLIIRSKELAKKIKSYFEKGDILKADVLQTNEEIYSFLLGIYFRNGFKITDQEYKYAHTYVNAERLFSLLLRIKCPDIRYVFYQDRRGITFSFQPSMHLEKYFNTIESLKMKKTDQKKKAWYDLPREPLREIIPEKEKENTNTKQP